MMNALFEVILSLMDRCGQTCRRQRMNIQVPMDVFWHEALRAYHKSDLPCGAPPPERRKFLKQFMMEKAQEVMRPSLDKLIDDFITADDTRNGYTKEQDAEFFSGHDRPSEGYHKHDAPRN